MDTEIRYTKDLQYMRLEIKENYIKNIKDKVYANFSDNPAEWQLEIKNAFEEFDFKVALQKMYSLFLFKKEIVIQEWTAILEPRLTCSTQHRTGMAIGYLIDAVLQGSHFKQSRTTEQWFIQCSLKFDLDLSKVGYILPSIEPLEKVSKYNIGYKYLKERILCGSKLNPMNGEFCLEHINKLNSLNLVFDTKVIDLIGFKFDERDKVKGDHIETVEEKEERKVAFNQLKDSLENRGDMVEGKVIHLAHKYDKRGRTYCKAFEFNYMGIKPIKAGFTLAKKEKINGTF